jgi:diguanylate cyclase
MTAAERTSEGLRRHAVAGRRSPRELLSRALANLTRPHGERVMTFSANLLRPLKFVGALAFIAFSALSAAQSRGDMLTEIYVLGLISISAMGFVVAGATAAPDADRHEEPMRTRAEARRDFERKVESTLSNVVRLIRDHALEGAKFQESLAGAGRRLSASQSYDTIHEIVLTLIQDNRAMQSKVNTLSEKLEQSRFQIVRLRSSLIKAEEIGNRDGLTGLGNRRFFDNALSEEIVKSQDFGGELCIALADLDHFKGINDRFGHVAGDMVLKLFAELLTTSVREQDRVARFGGEEFAILFPDSRLADAARVAQHIQRLLERKQWVVAATGERIGAITASFGLARLRDSETAEDLIQRADAKLYEAKAGGRNRVLVDLSGHVEPEVGT